MFSNMRIYTKIVLGFMACALFAAFVGGVGAVARIAQLPDQFVVGLGAAGEDLRRHALAAGALVGQLRNGQRNLVGEILDLAGAGIVAAVGHAGQEFGRNLPRGIGRGFVQEFLQFGPGHRDRLVLLGFRHGKNPCS